MTANTKLWLKELYTREIEEVKGTIRNEHLWELGYEGTEPNPHTENLSNLFDYLAELSELREELK